jgi:hypothetical protein
VGEDLVEQAGVDTDGLEDSTDHPASSVATDAQGTGAQDQPVGGVTLRPSALRLLAPWVGLGGLFGLVLMGAALIAWGRAGV